MEDKQQNYEFPSTELLPGVMYNADDQCRIEYGLEARHCDLEVVREQISLNLFSLPSFLLRLRQFFFFSISHYAAPPSLPYFPRYIMRLREELPYSLYFHHISSRARKNTCKPYLCLRSPKIMTSVTLSIHCCSIFNLIRLPVSSKGRKSILLFSHFHRFLNYEPFV